MTSRDVIRREFRCPFIHDPGKFDEVLRMVSDEASKHELISINEYVSGSYYVWVIWYWGVRQEKQK